MKAFLATAFLSLLIVSQALGQEQPSKIKIAVARLERVMGAGSGNQEQIRMLSADKDVRDALKAILAEMKALQKELLVVEDETRLEEIGQRLAFLNQKYHMICRRINVSFRQDAQKIVREFVAEHYKDQYALITMDPSFLDRFIYKEGVELVDITEDAAVQFKAYLDKILEN